MKRVLTLTAVVFFASCSIQVDSQYGLRLGPPSVRSHSAQPESEPDPSTQPAAAEPSQHTEAITETLAVAGAAAIYRSDAGGFSSLETNVPFPEHQAHLTAPPVDAPTADAEGNTPAHAEAEAEADAQKLIPYWVEVVLAILGLLLGLALLGSGAASLFMSVFSFGWGEPGLGTLLLFLGLASLILGWLLIRFIQNNVMSFHVGDLFYGRSRLLNVMLGILGAILVVLLSM